MTTCRIGRRVQEPPHLAGACAGYGWRSIVELSGEVHRPRSAMADMNRGFVGLIQWRVFAGDVGGNLNRPHLGRCAVANGNWRPKALLKIKVPEQYD